MLNLCTKCMQPIEDGEFVTVELTGKYHKIQSARSWSMYKDELNTDNDTLRHVRCYPEVY